jgi:hypothetical protein
MSLLNVVNFCHVLRLKTENGAIHIFFTLTPEKIPKVQQLNISFQPNVNSVVVK